MQLKKSLFTQFIVNSIAIGVLLIIGLLFVEANITHVKKNALDESLLHISQIVEKILDDRHSAKKVSVGIQDRIKSLSQSLGVRIEIISQDKALIADSSLSEREMQMSQASLSDYQINKVLQSGSQLHMLAIPNSSNKKISYISLIQINNETNYIRITLVDEQGVYSSQNLNMPMLIIFVIIYVAIILIGYRANKSIIFRIRSIRAIANKPSSMKPYISSLLRKGDEISQLSNSVQRMMQKYSNKVIKLQDRIAKNTEVMKNMAEGVIAIRHDLSIQLMNNSAKEIFQSTSDDPEQSPLLEVVKNTHIVEIARKSIKSVSTCRSEIELFRDDLRIISVSAVGLEPGKSKISCILVFQDITDVKQLDRVRQDFVANASHELRTPLTSINGFIETLISGAYKDPEISLEFLKTIHEDTQRLTRLTDDLLALSQIDSEKFTIRHQKLSIENVFDETIHLLRSKIESKGISISKNIDQTIDTIYADRDGLHQVMINLVDNAIKYSPENAEIIFGQKLKDDQTVDFWIEDHGMGIPEESLSRVFERFYRVDKARSQSVGGTGLGLSISRRIIEAHQGSIYCQSNPSKGTKFVFNLPIHAK